MATATRKCTSCKQRFSQSIKWIDTPAGWFHSFECAKAYSNKKTKVRKKEKFEKLKKEVTQDLKWWKAKAQATFNKYIRIRDKDKPCISCDAINYTMSAGHYKTVGGNSASLRFHPMNCHGQCWYNCNKNKSGNCIEARKGIVSRYGVSVIDEIESYHPPKKYTIDNLRVIDKWYKRKIKRLNEN